MFRVLVFETEPLIITSIPIDLWYTSISSFSYQHAKLATSVFGALNTNTARFRQIMAKISLKKKRENQKGDKQAFTFLVFQTVPLTMNRTRIDLWFTLAFPVPRTNMIPAKGISMFWALKKTARLLQ